jgi:sugar diacid utilization regulator
MYGKETRAYRTLSQALALLDGAGVIPRAAAELQKSVSAAAHALRRAVLEEVPAFAESGNPEILPGLERHINEHLSEVMRLFGGGEIGDFAFVKAHAQQRAEQRFPLEITLHAYRCGHRILSRWLRDAASADQTGQADGAVSAIADFAIEYTNVISMIVAAEYVAQTRRLAEAEGDQRTELLNILLCGYDESDGRVARLLKRAGYLEQRQSYCVVAAQSTNSSEMENPARAQRIADALSAGAAAISIRMLLGVRNNVVTAVLSSARRQSGWTAERGDISERLLPQLLLLGPSVLVGVSSERPSTSFLPKALVEAQIALDFATVANRVVHFPRVPLRSLLARRAGEILLSAAPNWAGALDEADARTQGVLAQTLRAIADADLNMQKAARLLGKHPNTVYARIDRVRELTGLNAQSFHDLNELLLAIDCRRR